jgi:hypothetical protein
MTPATPAGTGAPPPAPPATRRSRPGWRDPRLAIGLALVAASVVIGARVVGAADDTVGVWAMAGGMESGQPVSQDDLVRRQVRFADQDVADLYVSATAAVPQDAVLARSLGQGELLPRSALTERSRVGLTEVPMSVATGSLPPGLRVGAKVDVWLVASEGSRDSRTAAGARRHLEGAVVLAVGKDAGEFSVSGERQLLVGVPTGDGDQVAGFLGALPGSLVVVTRTR